MQSGFDKVVKKLVDKGVIYIGSSAGSVLACSTIEFIEDLDDRSEAALSSYKGLGLVDLLILPHFGDPEYETSFKKIMDKWSNKKTELVTLTNNQVVIVEGNSHRIVKVGN